MLSPGPDHSRQISWHFRVTSAKGVEGRALFCYTFVASGGVG